MAFSASSVLKKVNLTKVRFIILLGIALRIYAALARIDLVHMDEHFQNLEPASKVVFGFGWMSWEWSVGSRSWLVPALYMPLMFLFKLAGFEGGLAPIFGCRVMMALLSGWMLFRLDALLQRRGLGIFARSVTALFYAFSPSFIAWGATTLSDTWALNSLWIVLPTVYDKINTKEPRSWFFAGLLIGLSFLVRLQMVLWPIGILIVLVLRKTPFRLLGQAALGFMTVVLFQAVFDWVTWGFPLQSVIVNVKKNVFENVASFYGTAPFYDYIFQLQRNLGNEFWLFIAALILLTAIFRAVRFRFLDVLILVPAVLYFLVHSAIAHKENRFLLPIYPVFFYSIAVMIDGLAQKWGGILFPKIQRLEPALWVIAPGIAFLSSTQIYSSEHYYPYDLGDLMIQVREDGGLSTGRCIALFDHYWVWSHGELLQGRAVNYIEISSAKLFPEEFQSCIYTVMPPMRGRDFEARAGANWKRWGEDSRGQLLYKNVGP